MTGIAVLGFAYVLSQFYRYFLAVLTPVLTSELGMSVSELSIASGAWFATFALAQFPVGIWLDAYGPRRTAAVLHGVFAAGGGIIFATATGSNQIIIAMALIGVGCSPILMSAYVIFAKKFSFTVFATLSSTFIGVGMVGSILGAEPLATAVHLWGWRNVAFGLAIVSLITSFVVYLTVGEIKQTAKNDQRSYFDLFKIRQLWFLFPLITFSYAVPASVRGLWVGPHLEQVFGLDILGIGRIVLFISIAQILGTFVYGPLDRIFNTRKWIIIAGNLMVVLSCIFLASYPAASLFAVSLALVVMGFFGTASAVQSAHGKSFIPENIIGRGMTLLNFFSIGGVALAQFASGRIVEFSSNSQSPASGFTALYAYYAIFLGGALVIYLFCKDSKPR